MMIGSRARVRENSQFFAQPKQSMSADDDDDDDDDDDEGFKV